MTATEDGTGAAPRRPDDVPPPPPPPAGEAPRDVLAAGPTPPRDVLDSATASPRRSLSVPSRRTPTSVPVPTPQPAPTTAPASAAPPTPSAAPPTADAPATRRAAAPPDAGRVSRIGRGQVVGGVVVLAALLALGAWLLWGRVVGVPAKLEVDGAPIANADALLADGEDALRLVVDADGGTVPDGAGCWFAPPAADATTDAPRVACGPVLLGIAGDDERWLVGAPQYAVAPGADGASRATGTFDGFDGVAELRTSLLRHPEGRRVPAGDPTLGADGLRAEDGRVVSGLDATLAATERAFEAAALTSGAAVEEPRCWASAREATRAGTTVLVSDGRVLCGPVLLMDSAPDEIWAAYPVSLGAGDTVVEARMGEPSIGDLTGTVALAAGLVLHRPDGAEAPADAAGLDPPDADPVASGTALVLEALPDAVDTATPDDGRLVTPAATLRITGLARVPQVGTGAAAIVAPPGEELVVATFAVTRPEDPPPTDGTATVVAGGTRIAVDDWGDLRDGGSLVVSVPEGSGDVQLDVLFEERSQRISLVTGDRAAGAPAALYRGTTSVGVGAPFAVEVALPEGAPVTARGAVAELTLAGWTPDDGWAAGGRAWLTVRVDDWQLVEPCCDAPGLEVTPRWVLVLPDGTEVAGTGEPPSSGQVEVTFAVPEDVTAATLRLEIAADHTTGGGASRATGQTTLDLEVPA